MMNLSKNWLFAGSALVALAGAAQPATAQIVESSQPNGTTSEPASDGSTADAKPTDDIIVTGSRLGISGYNAPSPTKVLSSEDMNNRGLSNVGDFLNEIPSFRPTQTAQTNPQSALGAGQNYADLRALGSIRTLTLVDGHRFVPSSANGQVDLNLIPTILISRVDVVTGGASAAYGSDAVSGVVNVILNKRLEGFKADLSVGISDKGDAGERRASVAFGSAFGEGRGHIVLGGEYVVTDGIDSFFDRKFGREQGEILSYVGPRPAGAPSRFYGSGVQALNYAYGGVILGNNADTNPGNGVDVLRGIQFGPGGTVLPFPYGTAIGTSAINFTGGNSRLYPRTGHQLVLPLERKVAMAHIDYDLSESLSLFVEASYAQSTSQFHTSPVRDTTPTAVVIRRDNAFLPAPILAIMNTNNIASFGLGRHNSDFGEVRADNGNTTKRVAGGLSGKFGKSWSWDAYYQYGHNEFNSTIDNLRIEQNYRFAFDAILIGGQAVCRDVTARAAGCVPINLFGEGSPSAAAIDYVTGTALYNVNTTQEVAAANLRGSPFSTWAGPVAIAFGGEYRREAATATNDPISQASGFNYSNAKAFAGAYDVKEGYFEAEIPLARDLPLLRSLDLNGAIRYTDYSSTGGVTTWKLGATWKPIDGVLFRGTRSRDIRAPNNSELFSATSTRTSLRNPFNGATEQMTQISQPSPSLRPEVADTKSIGISLSPGILPGFNLSVDYYDIKIDGAVSSLSPQLLLDNCAAEVLSGTLGFFCGFVSRSGTGAATVINSVTTQLLNVASIKTSGIDFDASYRFGVGNANITARLAGNYTAHLITDDGQGIARSYAAGVITNVGSVVDRAGQLGGFTSGLNNGATSVPHWIVNGSLTYALDGFSTTLQGRYIQGGVLDRTLVGPGDPDYDPASPISIGSNRVKGAFYTNLSASYDVFTDGNRKFQIYGVINNLTDKGPPFPAIAVTGLFDRIGRSYKVGVRVAY